MSGKERRGKRGYVALTQKEVNFLDSLSKKCKKKGGKELCREKILKAFITAAKELNMDINGVDCRDDLITRIKQAFARHR